MCRQRCHGLSLWQLPVSNNMIRIRNCHVRSCIQETACRWSVRHTCMVTSREPGAVEGSCIAAMRHTIVRPVSDVCHRRSMLMLPSAAQARAPRWRGGGAASKAGLCRSLLYWRANGDVPGWCAGACCTQIDDVSSADIARAGLQLNVLIKISTCVLLHVTCRSMSRVMELISCLINVHQRDPSFCVLCAACKSMCGSV